MAQRHRYPRRFTLCVKAPIKTPKGKLSKPKEGVIPFVRNRECEQRCEDTG